MVLQQVLQQSAKYKIGNGRFSHIFVGSNLNLNNNHKKFPMDFFEITDVYGNISVITLRAVQPFDKYLAAVWKVQIYFYFFVEYLMFISKW